jgi:exodeoxyribonuclease V alpha subunit
MNEAASQAATVLRGRVAKINYQSPQNAFTVAKLKVDNSQATVTIVGPMAGAAEGATVQVQGYWRTHPRFGDQFQVTELEVSLPATAEGIEAYLASGAVSGIGPRLAHSIVGYFGAQTLEVLDREPARLTEIEGIGAIKAERIGAHWAANQRLMEVSRFLATAGVNAAGMWAGQLIAVYGDETLPMLRTEPFTLCVDFALDGFTVADAVADYLGQAPDDPARLWAACRHLLEKAASEGHVYTPEAELRTAMGKLTGVATSRIAHSLENQAAEGSIAIEALGDDDSRVVTVQALFDAESGIAQRLQSMMVMPAFSPTDDRQSHIARVFEQLAIKPAAEQVQVLQKIAEHRLAIITGGPGTGKTTLVQAIAALLRAEGERVILAAPTGRAARRLAERCPLADTPAATLHRLLGFNLEERRFLRNRDSQLAVDTVIVDEASMVDTPLMFHFLNALPIDARLIMVGDVHQLPSVGPGNVLADLLASGILSRSTAGGGAGKISAAAYELTHVYRQAEASPIIRNAYRVLHGEALEFEPPTDDQVLSEFVFFQQANPAAAARTVVDLCTRQIPQHYGLNPLHEIQVLTPMHKGDAGTINLNRMLQAALNPRDNDPSLPASPFRIGDKVMHLKNDYQKTVFNGDIGAIEAIDQRNALLQVRYEGRLVDYTFSELGNLTLAYAISVHKAQGSEYPAVVIPLVTQHYMLLQRNLLYTAITRGQKLVVIVGMPKALRVALENDKPRWRRTQLRTRLDQKHASAKTGMLRPADGLSAL